VFVCKQCGFIGYEGSCLQCNGPPEEENPYLQNGKKRRDENMCAIKIPYASKLMLQEL
jgi:hypothetical protein